MGLSREELLRPSLKDVPVASAPYTVSTMFLTAFFGGPFAAIAIIGANSVRLRRLRQDLLPLGLILAVTVGILGALYLAAWSAEMRAYLLALAGPRALSFVARVIGLAIFGVGYAMHRSEQRGADFMGLDRPNGWIGGIACIAAGTAATFVFGLLIAIPQEL